MRALLAIFIRDGASEAYGEAIAGTAGRVSIGLRE